MLSFVYCVVPIGFILMAGGVDLMMKWISKLNLRSGFKLAMNATLFLIVLLSVFRPDKFYKIHIAETPTSHIGVINRQQKIHNTEIYKNLDKMVKPGTILLNAPYGEHVEAMFFSEFTVYYDWPDETEFMSKIKAGYEFAYFPARYEPIPPIFEKHATPIDTKLMY